MSRRGEELKELCRKYIDGQLDATKYTDIFNEYYLLYEDEMDDRELALFDNIYIANELYTLEDSSRKKDFSCVSEKNLKNVIAESLNT